MHRTTIVLAIAYVVLFASAYGLADARPKAAALSSSQSAEFVGSERCALCHKAEHSEWRGSQHAAAMQVATDASVLGNFADATFTKDGIESRFFRRDGKFLVTTDGADGKLSEFEIRYTFGVYPLQQYLIALPGGRLQAFAIAWDARPETEGGQRWFHLYPDRTLRAGERLHWTGIDQNWNFQCAACHSTHLEKNYDPATRSFATTWSEISVGCEACHGPGARHVAWAAAKNDADPLRGFAKRLNEREGVTWTIGPQHTAARSRPLTSDKELETCAACHSRREQLSNDRDARFLDAFRPSLIEAGLYHADGQQRDEVFIHGSYLQSRMHAAGVTCSDCHNPHSGKLRQAGNALCGQCHDASHFDTASHHHHPAGSKGAECMNCHMPQTVYMGIDGRRDHSFRIPRPDLTHVLGVPNACQTCHGDKSARSLADAIKDWFPHPKSGFQSFANAFDRAERGAPGADAALIDVIEGAREPAVVRASALAKLRVTPRSHAVVLRALGDPNALVRLAAAETLGRADPQSAHAPIVPLLSDESRAVRMEAARILAGAGERALDERSRAMFKTALKEYIAAQDFNADRPEQHLNLAGLFLARGQIPEAHDATERALTIDPSFGPAYVMRAEVERTQGDEAAAERTLRHGLAVVPASAELTHALGLSLIRQKRYGEALEALVEAAKQAPDVSRYTYVAAVALKESKRSSEGMALLQAALGRHPYDRDLLVLLAMLELESRDTASARAHIKLLLELEPESAEAALLSALVERRQN